MVADINTNLKQHLAGVLGDAVSGKVYKRLGQVCQLDRAVADHRGREADG